MANKVKIIMPGSVLKQTDVLQLSCSIQLKAGDLPLFGEGLIMIWTVYSLT